MGQRALVAVTGDDSGHVYWAVARRWGDGSGRMSVVGADVPASTNPGSLDGAQRRHGFRRSLRHDLLARQRSTQEGRWSIRRLVLNGDVVRDPNDAGEMRDTDMEFSVGVDERDGSSVSEDEVERVVDRADELVGKIERLQRQVSTRRRLEVDGEKGHKPSAS